jgi:hypothetical protein
MNTQSGPEEAAAEPTPRRKAKTASGIHKTAPAWSHPRPAPHLKGNVMSKPITTAPTAEALAQLLRDEGFTPAAPRHLRPETVAVDRHACQRLRCPACRQRGCVYRPFTDGRAYRVLACCQACGAAAEI